MSYFEKVKMLIDAGNLKELKYLANNYCLKHRMPYLAHYNCYLNDFNVKEKVGFLDIETSNLAATFGIILSYCIKEQGGKILGRALRKDELRGDQEDRQLIKECITDINKFDRLVVYYGGDYRFDLPFIRTKAIEYGLEFPKYAEKIVTDVYTIVKKKLRLHRNRLETACDTFHIPCKTHRLDGKTWRAAGRGDEKALKYILAHNKEDVISLEMLYDKVLVYIKQGKASI